MRLCARVACRLAACTPPGDKPMHFVVGPDLGLEYRSMTLGSRRSRMNSRMSRLRRSLSRSVHQLTMSRSNQSLNGLVLLPTATHTTLVDKFASVSNFDTLRQLVQGNNTLLKEVVAIFEEKAQLDFNYAKSLKKLSARLYKATQHVECEVDKGWVTVAEQLDVQATIHNNLGSAFVDDIVQPLRSIQVGEQKTIRAAEVLVERETIKWKNKRDENLKLKRTLHATCKELERTDQTIDKDKSGDPEKYTAKRKRLHESARKQEDSYIWHTVDVEKQRRVMEGVLRKGVESLEAVERQRLAHCQTALGRYQRKIEQLAPNMQQMFERQTNNLDIACDCDADSYITALQPSTSAANDILLADFYAENLGEIMAGERRRECLDRVCTVFEGELKRLEGQGRADTIIAHAKQMTLVEYIEYLHFKVNEVRGSLEGNNQRGYHRLSRFQHKLKDKMGLPMTVLTMPLSGEDQSLPPPSLSIQYAPSSSRSGEEYDDYDKISDEGFCNSPSRPTTVIDEPAQHATLCRVLYDFQPTDDEEIRICAGDCVLVEEKLDENWLIGHVLNNNGVQSKTGRFPTSYVAF